MTRTLLVFVVMTIGLLGTSAADARRAHPCKPRGARLVMQEERTRIYVAHSREWFGDVLHACSMKHRRPVALGEDVEEVAVAHPFVATRKEGLITLGPWYAIDVYDLRRGRRVRGDQGTHSASDLVLSRYGVAAWIATSGGHQPGPRGVWKMEGEGKELLDPGEVERGSLALSTSHRRLYWTRAGAPYSAELGALN